MELYFFQAVAFNLAAYLLFLLIGLGSDQAVLGVSAWGGSNTTIVHVVVQATGITTDLMLVRT